MLQDIAEWLLFGFVAGAVVGLIVGGIVWGIGYPQHFWSIMRWTVGTFMTFIAVIFFILSRVHF